MAYAPLTALDSKRLRRWLTVFFLALAIPAAILIHQAYSELRWEAFHVYRLQAEELAARIDAELVNLVEGEEARAFTDYAFLNVAGDPSANLLQRSPLSVFPVASAFPGLIGYFQIDTLGAFSTPLVPRPTLPSTRHGIPVQELRQRTALANRIRQILDENRLVQSDSDDRQQDTKLMGSSAPLAQLEKRLTPAGGAENEGNLGREREAADEVPRRALQAERVAAQAAFDRLEQTTDREAKEKQRYTASLGRVDDLKLDFRYQEKDAIVSTDETTSSARQVLTNRARKERSTLPELSSLPAAEAMQPAAPVSPAMPIRTFESEIDPFEASLLDSGHFVLFRKVWRDRQRYIQGALVEQQLFLEQLVEAAFLDTALSTMSSLIVAYQGDVFSAYSGQRDVGYSSGGETLRGTVLNRVRLSAPFDEMELIFTVQHLPPGPGSSVILWVAAVLAIVLCGGFYMTYRLGMRQIALVRQQQDFVSAISHELKTPLTSIRMYAEMLREGWASDQKKAHYYQYIQDESERLSRLINNVLQLARLTRNEVRADMENTTVGELLQTVRAKTASQIEHAGFNLSLNCEDAVAQRPVAVDVDYFTQIMINLVDNAIKFAASAENKVIDLGCRLRQDDSLAFYLRDYGPGVPRDQMKKIFELFYRSENELTRETIGTGIGLALVRQLALAMNGRVDVVNRQPGAEFTVVFAAPSGSTS